MKTLVEFYDLDSLKNIASACCFNPENLVFICERSKVTQLNKKGLGELLAIRNLQCTMYFYEVSRTNIAEITETCKKIATEFEDCVFDFTGGRELMLICAGIYCKENNVPAFYLDLIQGKLIDVIGCGKYKESFELSAFNVAQILKLYGATYERCGHCEKDVPIGDFEEILSIFDVFKENVAKWGYFVKYLQTKKANEDIDLRFLGAKTGEGIARILNKLNNLGVINSLKVSAKGVSFMYKNQTIKQWLKIQGVWLELFTYIAAVKSNYFDDVQMSVVLNWDSETFDESTAKNEIDVILVKGARPIFISCKTGVPDTFALNEIRLLSNKFGGSLAKTVMVTSRNIFKEHYNLYLRAKLLKICVVEIEDLELNKLGLVLKDITTGMYKYKNK